MSIKTDDVGVSYLFLYATSLELFNGGQDTKGTHKDDTIEALLEPCHCVLLLNAVRETDSGLLLPPSRYACTWAAHHDIEVHTEDTNTGVVSCAQVDVLLDTETEVSCLREVLTPQLVFLHFQATLQNLLSLGSADGDMYSDFLITTDTECADGVSSF